MAVKFSVLNSHSNLALDFIVAEGLLALPLLFFFSLFALPAAVEVEAAAAAAGAAPAISRVLATGDQIHIRLLFDQVTKITSKDVHIKAYSKSELYKQGKPACFFLEKCLYYSQLEEP